MDAMTFQSMFSDLQFIDLTAIQHFLDMSARKIAREAISVQDPNYDDLQYNWSAHLMLSAGYLKKPINSERVGDVGLGYENGNLRGYADQYERDYYLLRLEIQGAAPMISDTFNLPLF